MKKLLGIITMKNKLVIKENNAGIFND